MTAWVEDRRGDALMVTGNPPREVARFVRRVGGRIERMKTHWDAERGGRVVEFVMFWPELTGYDQAPQSEADVGQGQ